jgi:cystathionine beta-synthase
MSDKISKEKVNLLRALGAEVVLCPSKVLPEHPDSVYSTAQRLEAEIPNSAYLNQYDNTANLESHYASTGPEIWRQTEGRITHFVSSMGTCGTMCGTSRFLKEQNPAIVCVGVDAFGSTLKAAHATGKADQAEIYPYLTEALGKDFMPANMDRTVIDHVIQVHDRDSALMARRMAREESLMVGWSCGAAVVAALQVAKTLEPTDLMVVMLHDHGSRYMGKIFNDEWMVQQGFLTPEEAGLVPA